MVILSFLLILFFGLIVPTVICVYVINDFICDIKGAPFVPTSSKIIDEILQEARLRKDQLFIELGSGDSRVVSSAVKKYGVKGIGYDLNLLLIFYSRITTKLKGIKNINFFKQNIFDANIENANVIFLFLMPKTLIKLKSKILNECKKEVLIISHGFKIAGWEKYLINIQQRKLFPTYFYKIK